jgi:galactokinase
MKSVIARAPGRVNIIGEHTDYTGGYVFPMAIELGVTAHVSTRDDRKLLISSNLINDSIELDLDELAPNKVHNWSDYVAGSVWSVARFHKIPFGLDIRLTADLPLGAGMSSSAAVECSVILALTQLLEINPGKRELARWAKDAENIYVGVPTGSMDQVASLFGKKGHALFFDTRDDVIEQVPIDLTSQNSVFAVIDTRTKHALVDGGYAARRADCEVGSKILGVEFLRDINDLNSAIDTLKNLDADERIIKRVRHVVSENQRVLDAVAALKNNDLTQLGILMNASHESLKSDFEVSCEELNLAVAVAITCGAYGARMMGGGFGGSAIALIPKDKVSELTQRVTQAFDSSKFNAPKVYQVTASEGAHIVQ